MSNAAGGHGNLLDCRCYYPNGSASGYQQAIDKLDIDTYVAMNVEKVNKKRALAGQKPIKNVKVMPEEPVEIKNHGKEKSVADTPAKTKSLAEKAQMVKRYNERMEKEHLV